MSTVMIATGVAMGLAASHTAGSGGQISSTAAPFVAFALMAVAIALCLFVAGMFLMDTEVEVARKWALDKAVMVTAGVLAGLGTISLATGACIDLLY